MAFLKECTKPDKTTGNFWSLYSVQIDCLHAKKIILIGLWIDQQAFEDDAQPMMVKRFIVPVTGTEAAALQACAETELLQLEDFADAEPIEE